MASNIQRFGAPSNFIGLKLMFADKLGNHALKLVSRISCASHQYPAGPALKFYPTNGYRLYSTSPAPTAGYSSEQAQFGPAIGLLFSPSHYRLPLKAPPIINQRLIIDYKIPARLPTPKVEILDHPPVLDKTIEAPDTPNSTIRKAKGRPGLVYIRRIKMNKHKLKKRRKKLKYLILKIDTRREMRKEKEFLNALMAQIKEADKFDAKSYVNNIIAKAKEKPPVVMMWKGNRLPDWLVKQKLEEEAAAKKREYLSILDKRDQGKLKS